MKVPSALIGLQSLSLGVFLGQVAATPLPPKPSRATVADGTAALDQGTVKGFTDDYGNSVFLGIPFAQTTGGQNRYVMAVLHRLRFTDHCVDGRLPRTSRS